MLHRIIKECDVFFKPAPIANGLGLARSKLSPVPSCPLLLCPQHITLPPLTKPHEWEYPEDTATATAIMDSKERFEVSPRTTNQFVDRDLKAK